MFLGCFARENITCPAIDISRILLDCKQFCLCSFNGTNPDKNKYHCLEPINVNDCPITTPPPPTSTTPTTTTTMPPATPTPEDDCPDDY